MTRNGTVVSDQTTAMAHCDRFSAKATEVTAAMRQQATITPRKFPTRSATLPTDKARPTLATNGAALTTPISDALTPRSASQSESPSVETAAGAIWNQKNAQVRATGPASCFRILSFLRMSGCGGGVQILARIDALSMNVYPTYGEAVSPNHDVSAREAALSRQGNCPGSGCFDGFCLALRAVDVHWTEVRTVVMPHHARSISPGC